MGSHVFHEVFLHLNWHTKTDHPTLRGHVEQLTHAFLREKSGRIKSVRLAGLGGTDTHVHLAVRVEPFVRISELVQELKGASAHEVNRRLGHKAVEWQRGYGVVSFGRKHLPWILDYIERQREHHARGAVQPRLEACEPDELPDEPSKARAAKPAEAGHPPSTRWFAFHSLVGLSAPVGFSRAAFAASLIWQGVPRAAGYDTAAGLLVATLPFDFALFSA